MADDNPFASPSGDLPARPPMPGPVDPAYQQQGWSPYGGPPPRSRGIPKSLVAACHISAVGAWTFVGAIALLWAIFTNADGVEAFVAILMLFAFGGIVALVLMGGLVVAVLGAVTAIPLYAIWRGERATDESSDSPERFAIFHMVVAWIALLYVLARILW